MCSDKKVYGIIPARYESKRFPGKPLADILGKPMFYHVYERARKCVGITEVVLATDDQRIYNAAKTLKVPVIMTRSDHKSGTDRIIEAAESVGAPHDAIIINIQGDEPALKPSMLTALIQPFEDAQVKVATLIKEISITDAKNPNIVKVVYDKAYRALYFSRSMIPNARDLQSHTYFGHIGIYAFKMDVLKQFQLWQQTPLEKIEKLEQLRILENGISIHLVKTKETCFGVDRPEDIETVVQLLRNEV